MHCRARNWQLLAVAVPSSTLNPELTSASSCCDRGGNNWSKTRKKRRKQEKGNLIIAPLPNSGQESQSWFTVEKRRRACCIGLAVQAGVHNPHGSGHKSGNCRLQKAGMAFTREKQQHTA